MLTFVRVVEVWVPDAGHTLLELAGGVYGSARRFASSSRSMCFGRAEGLPGQAWEQRRPIVLKSLQGSYFRRAPAAAADGLTCGIALPVFAGERLAAVVLIFCGDDAEHAGAVEVWRNAPGSPDLALDDGYYGTTADVFEFASRNITFRKGIGLPGLAWAAGMPVFMPDLGKGTRFLRSDSAVKVGINRGFAMPCPAHDGANYVMAFLSALATPIVRRFETWLPDARGGHLARSEGFCELDGLLDAGAAAEAIAGGHGVLARAFATGVPAIAEPASADMGAAGEVARTAGFWSAVALPVMRGRDVVAVVAWYF